MCATLGSVPLVAYGPQTETYQYGTSDVSMILAESHVLFRYTEAVARRLCESLAASPFAVKFLVADFLQHV